MKKLLKSPWTIGISTTILGFILTVGYDLIRGKQFLTTIRAVPLTVWNAIIAFFNFELKVWWVIIGLIVCFVVLYVWSNALDKSTETKPDFITYRNDIIGNWKWSWDWEKAYDGRWRITDIEAHCPKCDTPMFSDWHEDTYQCPRCSYQQYKGHKLKCEVEAVVIDNLKRRLDNKSTDS